MTNTTHFSALFASGGEELSTVDTLKVVAEAVATVAFIVWALCPFKGCFMPMLYACLKAKGVL